MQVSQVNACTLPVKWRYRRNPMLHYLDETFWDEVDADIESEWLIEFL